MNEFGWRFSAIRIMVLRPDSSIMSGETPLTQAVKDFGDGFIPLRYSCGVIRVRRDQLARLELQRLISVVYAIFFESGRAKSAL
jgi:hypothetical protein